MRKILVWLRNHNWQRLLANTALFVGLFLIFLYLTFPYDVIRETIAEKLEGQGKFGVTIGAINPFRLTGVRMTGLILSDVNDPKKVYLDIDEARVRVRPTQLLRGRLWMDFDIYAYGGGIAGSFCKHGAVFDMAMNFVDLHLQKYRTREIVSKYGQFDLDGVAGGDFNMHVAKGSRKGNSGGLNLSLDRLKIANIIILGKQLPNLSFEPSKLSMELQQHQFKLNDFNLKGNALEVKANGQVFVNEDTLSKSRLNITLKMKLGDEIDEALGILAMGLGEPDNDGFYTYRLNGPLDNISARK